MMDRGGWAQCGGADIFFWAAMACFTGSRREAASVAHAVPTWCGRGVSARAARAAGQGDGVEDVAGMVYVDAEFTLMAGGRRRC